MTKNLLQIIEANNKYSKEFDKGGLSAQPKKKYSYFNMYGCQV